MEAAFGDNEYDREGKFSGFFINYHKMMNKISNKIIVHLLHQANYSYRFWLIKTHQDYLNDTHLIMITYDYRIYFSKCPRARFLKGPGNFSGPMANFKI